MPIDPRIRNNQSFSTNINYNKPETFAGRYSRPTESVYAKINDYTNMNSTFRHMKFPSDLGENHYFEIQVSNYKRTDLLHVDFKLETTIKLPLPENIFDMHAVDYATPEIGLGMGMASSYLATNMSQSNGIKDFGKKILGQATTAYKDMSFGQGAADVAIGGLAATAGSNAERTLEPFLGFSPNMFQTVLLSGPKYKTYEFSWNLLPRSPRESDMIRAITTYLNDSASPGLGLSGAVFTYPRIVRCCFSDKDFRHLYRFKPAVMSSILVNYTPAGMPSFYHDNGQGQTPPESVKLTISFLEIEYWLAGDYSSQPNERFPTSHHVGETTNDGFAQSMQQIYDGFFKSEPAANNGGNTE